MYDLNLGIYIRGEEKTIVWSDSRCQDPSQGQLRKILVLTEEFEGKKARISRLMSQDSSRDTVLESQGGVSGEGAGAEPGLG